MRKGFHTDLAYERKRPKQAGGYDYEECALGLCQRHTLTVKTQAAARATGCARGTYHTLLFPSLTTLGEAEREEISERLSALLSEMAAAALGTRDVRGQRILVLGLGNRAHTVDALGPLVAGRVNATAHLRREAPGLLEKLACAEIAVFTPGATAESGMESSGLALAAAEHFSPSLVLAVDALAARSFARLGTTVQLTDTGIAPGAGIGHARAALDRSLLGCPVLAIGAPTVIGTETLIRDLLAEMKLPTPRAWRKRTGISDGCFVCPQEADSIITHLSAIIAGAINRTFGLPDL